MTTDAPAVMFVRLRPGIVAESLRVVHVVPVPDISSTPAALIAYCRLRILPGTADLLTEPTGMPCERCLAKRPLPSHPQLPAHP